MGVKFSTNIPREGWTVPIRAFTVVNIANKNKSVKVLSVPSTILKVHSNGEFFTCEYIVEKNGILTKETNVFLRRELCLLEAQPPNANTVLNVEEKLPNANTVLSDVNCQTCKQCDYMCDKCKFKLSDDDYGKLLKKKNVEKKMKRLYKQLH